MDSAAGGQDRKRRRAARPRNPGAGPGSDAFPGASSAPKRRKRFLWTDDLHRNFVAAIFDHGMKACTPKILFELMQPTPGNMTSDHIKSHLQKFRANSKVSREEFAADYARSLGEAQGRFEEASAAGRPVFPPGFSTYPLSMPPEAQRNPPPHGSAPPPSKSWFVAHQDDQEVSPAHAKVPDIDHEGVQGALAALASLGQQQAPAPQPAAGDPALEALLQPLQLRAAGGSNPAAPRPAVSQGGVAATMHSMASSMALHRSMTAAGASHVSKYSGAAAPALTPHKHLARDLRPASVASGGRSAGTGGLLGAFGASTQAGDFSIDGLSDLGSLGSLDAPEGSLDLLASSAVSAAGGKPGRALADMDPFAFLPAGGK